jgi:gamma-glutamylcyclotransferase
MVYYFAYASNLSRKQMSERLPDSKPLFAAVLPNYKLVFSGWSRVWHGATATLQASHGDKVAGGVYEISEHGLSLLDAKEGFPSEYKHLSVIVFPDTGKPVEAVTFIRSRQMEESRPSPDYLAVIKQGYRDWGLV